MTILYLNYFCSKIYDNPNDWLVKMQPINTVLEQLALKHQIISVQQINYGGEITKQGVSYRFINWYKQTPRLPFKLHYLVKSLRPNIIVVHGCVFPLQTILLRLMMGKEVMIIVQHHAELPFNGIKKWLQKRASTLVNGYFFPAKKDGIYWQQMGNIATNKPIFNIHEGASTIQQIDSTNAKLLTKANGKPIYIWVGRLDANKNPLLTVKAFLKLRHIQPSAMLYMIFYRDEMLDAITEYLNQQKYLQNNIILVGKVAAYNMPYWYSTADFFISSSFKEGTSFSLSEAMSCGCVPIVTDIATHVNMLDNSCGLVYKKGNTTALFEALTASTKMNIKIEKQKTLQQYNKHLSATAIAKNIELAIAKLV